MVFLFCPCAQSGTKEYPTTVIRRLLTSEMYPLHAGVFGGDSQPLLYVRDDFAHILECCDGGFPVEDFGSGHGVDGLDGRVLGHDVLQLVHENLVLQLVTIQKEISGSLTL